MHVLKLIFLAVALSSAPSAMAHGDKRQAATYPNELRGTWDIGPQACKLPVNPDSDTPLRIEVARVLGYEHVETPLQIRAVATDPRAWTVTATSDIAPGIKTSDVYILKGDHLTITDGETVRQYRRCK
jgi:hypothetical protein